jgi:hypothetical protein
MLSTAAARFLKTIVLDDLICENGRIYSSQRVPNIINTTNRALDCSAAMYTLT